jgi:hypothetical protein
MPCRDSMTRVMIKFRVLLPVLLIAGPAWLMVAAFARQAAPAPDVIAVQGREADGRRSEPGA